MIDLTQVGVFLLTEDEEENTTEEVSEEESNNDDEFTFVYDENDLPIPTNKEAKEQWEQEIQQTWLEDQEIEEEDNDNDI